jgi:putative endonuclease
MDPTPAPSTDGRLERGRRGEDAALAAYLERGFRLVARNWRSRLGEVDLILERGELLVFCEVKTRGGEAFGGGFESVTAAKRRKLRSLGELFVAAHPPRHERIRLDVASVLERSGAFEVEIFEDAF